MTSALAVDDRRGPELPSISRARRQPQAEEPAAARMEQLDQAAARHCRAPEGNLRRSLAIVNEISCQ